MEIKAPNKLAPFFVIARNVMMGTSGKGDKNIIQTNNAYNFTLMPSFLPVEKTTKNHQNDVL